MDVLFRVSADGALPLVVGTMTRAIVTRAESASFVGVRFKPGEAFAFLDVTAADARDATLTPIDAGRPEIEALADGVARATPNACARAIDEWLLARLPRARPADARVRRAIDLLVLSRGTVRVAQIAEAVGVGDRQLERAFAERVGIGPKALARVLRLQSLVARLDAERAPVAWAELACDAGYADQAHLVREARDLAGVTPTELLRERRNEMSDSFNPSSNAHRTTTNERSFR
jgi:methylphosphotriester-DNA--protein-cysteine methyltransferase